MRIFLTGCPHFGHANMFIKHGRPFRDIDEMDGAMIDNWNNVVTPEDTVYLLGDVTMGRTALEYLEMLSGDIIVIPGNHDRMWVKARAFDWRQTRLPMGTVRVGNLMEMFRYRNRTCVTVCHYQMERWPGYGHPKRPGYHFHAHAHGKSKRMNYRLDVSMDANDFCPVLLTDAMRQATPGGKATWSS